MLFFIVVTGSALVEKEFKILNGYDNIDINSLSRLTKRGMNVYQLIV